MIQHQKLGALRFPHWCPYLNSLFRNAGTFEPPGVWLSDPPASTSLRTSEGGGAKDTFLSPISILPANEAELIVLPGRISTMLRSGGDALGG